MSASPSSTSAKIIPFPKRPVAPHVFTARDRLDVMHWLAEDRGGIRLSIHKCAEGDPPDVGEYASIYPANAPWAAWGAVRQGASISVWRARDGKDLGRYDTMQEVLAMLADCMAPSRQSG